MCNFKFNVFFFPLLSTQGGKTDHKKGQQSVFDEQNAKTSGNFKTVGFQVSDQQFGIFPIFFFLLVVDINQLFFTFSVFHPSGVFLAPVLSLRPRATTSNAASRGVGRGQQAWEQSPWEQSL